MLRPGAGRVERSCENPGHNEAKLPHIHLQTSADLAENTSIQEILDGLVATLSRLESVDPRAVKAYHSLRSVWSMGAGAKPGFATCEISLLAGRPEALRAAIADAMYTALREAFAQSVTAGDVQLTLEVREMDPATYRK